ncbi:MAG: hypothetical protein AAGJ35_02090 [Myxococcota bacterium]
MFSRSDPKARTQPVEKAFRHELTLRLHLTTESTALDDGFSSELFYRLRYAWWLDLQVSLRYAPQTLGNSIRYSVTNYIHLHLPWMRDSALGLGWMNRLFPEVRRGENLIYLLHDFDTKFFAFSGGIVLRFPLMDVERFPNPFVFSGNYVEGFYLYDFRVKFEHSFPKLGGALLRYGLGMMNFVDQEILSTNQNGFRLFVDWEQPKIGHFGLQAGMISYGFWAFAGFYGRWFLRFAYTYTFWS